MPTFFNYGQKDIHVCMSQHIKQQQEVAFVNLKFTLFLLAFSNRGCSLSKHERCCSKYGRTTWTDCIWRSGSLSYIFVIGAVLVHTGEAIRTTIVSIGSSKSTTADWQVNICYMPHHFHRLAHFQAIIDCVLQILQFGWYSGQRNSG